MDLLELQTPPEAASLNSRQSPPVERIAGAPPPELEFTGERMIPGQVEFQLEAEHRARYEFVARILPKGRVLDDGCGAGYGSVLLASHGFDVVGVDIDPETIAHCQRNCARTGLQFQREDSARLGFRTASFDAVVSFEVIEHIAKYEEYLAEAHRVLRPGGVLVISTPNKRVYSDSTDYRNPFHVHEFYLEEFQELLGRLFPSVNTLGQWCTNGIFIGTASKNDSPIAGGWLLRSSNEASVDRQVLESARYFVAVCRKGPVEQTKSPPCASQSFITELSVTVPEAPPRPEVAKTSVQTESSPVSYRQGFYQDEGGWRWMGKQSRLQVPHGSTPAQLAFNLTCSSLSFYGAPALETRISLNKIELRTEIFSRDNESRRVELTIPASKEDVTIDFRSSAFFLPGRCGWPGDQRELAVRLGQCRLAAPGALIHADAGSAATPRAPQSPTLQESQNRVRALERELSQAQTELAKYRTWRAPGHFYSPVPDPDEVRKRENEIFRRQVTEVPGIDLREADQLSLLKSLAHLYADQPFADQRLRSNRYCFDNPNFGHADALALHCMLRHLRPQRIVEVGSGYSSCVILDTNDAFLDRALSCTFVEPYPELFLSLIKDRQPDPLQLVPLALQDVELALFKTLKAGDILFVDSTHVSKTGSDVNRLLFEILPSLDAGVYVHFHDIFFPFEYPKDWVYEGRAWNENYVLRAFLQYNPAFQIELFNDYLAVHHFELLQRLVPAWTNNTGASIWLKKVI